MTEFGGNGDHAYSLRNAGMSEEDRALLLGHSISGDFTTCDRTTLLSFGQRGSSGQLKRKSRKSRGEGRHKDERARRLASNPLI